MQPDIFLADDPIALGSAVRQNAHHRKIAGRVRTHDHVATARIDREHRVAAKPLNASPSFDAAARIQLPEVEAEHWVILARPDQRAQLIVRMQCPENVQGPVVRVAIDLLPGLPPDEICRTVELVDVELTVEREPNARFIGVRRGWGVDSHLEPARRSLESVEHEHLAGLTIRRITGSTIAGRSSRFRRWA
jgi:hypothetical protein